MLHKVGRAKGHGLILYRLNVYGSESGGGGGDWGAEVGGSNEIRVVKNRLERNYYSQNLKEAVYLPQKQKLCGFGRYHNGQRRTHVWREPSTQW